MYTLQKNACENSNKQQQQQQHNIMYSTINITYDSSLVYIWCKQNEREEIRCNIRGDYHVSEWFNNSLGFPV